MKIGIMTFWWAEDNYGQILQCYALQKYLRDKGHDAFLIRYDPRNDYEKTNICIKLLKALNPFKLYKYLENKNRHNKVMLEHKHNPRDFDCFRSTYIRQSEKLYTSYEQLKSDPPEADIYVVGSDQVWNFYNQRVNKCKNKIHAYFLDFGNNKTKRMSYAASWSVNRLNKDIADEIRPLLQRFDYISVRERAGLQLCEDLGVKAEWVPDPTLLLAPVVYRNLYKGKGISIKSKPYLFLYLLGNNTKYSLNVIHSWAKKKNIDIVYITANSKIDPYNKVYANIQQWLFLLDNADYVITNSFHCCVFSSLFEKQFAVLPVKGSIDGMNTRLESLWELLEITPRVINKNDFSILDEKYKTRLSENSIEPFL